MDYHALGKRIREERLRLNLTQEKLAEEVGVSTAYIGQIERAAGTFAQLVAKDENYAQLRMPSGEIRKINLDCFATVGQVGNLQHENVSLGKAGRKIWMGIRPTVRGVVMNPVDHPHGGGEGRTSGGRHPVTPWGQPTRGYKTRSNKRTTKFIVKRIN